jgi:hypothetical protein
MEIADTGWFLRSVVVDSYTCLVLDIVIKDTIFVIMIGLVVETLFFVSIVIGQHNII